MDEERAARFAEQWYAAWKGGRVAAETVFLDENDRVTRYFAHYDG